MKKVTVGIISYKRYDDFKTLINIINDTKFAIDLIVVDNNETDLLKDVLAKIVTNNKITTKYIWEGKNFGVAGGRNKIFENLSTPYLILLDDDVYVEDINHVIEKVINVFESEKEVGAIAFHLVNYYSKKEFKEEIPHANKKLNLNKDFYTYLFIGAGHALRKDVIKKVGFLDESFGFYGMEEIDYAFRLINEGYKIKFVSDIIVYHKKNPQGRMPNEYVIYKQFINRVGISIKHLKVRYIVSSFIIWYIYTCLKARKIFPLKKVFDDLKEFYNKRNPFKQEFYSYIKSCKGRLWW